MAHFKIEAEISAFMCSLDKGQELGFRYKSPAPVFVSIKQRERPGDSVCTALTVRDLEPEINSELHHSIIGDKINFSKIRPDVRKAINNIFFELRAVSRSTVTIFNWTLGLDSPPDPCPSVRSRPWYSEDGDKWFEYSMATKAVSDVATAPHSIYARIAQIDVVVRKVEGGAHVPLDRQLFYEAWSQIGSNPRSALVIGVAAAEVGLNRLIDSRVPAQKRPSVGTIVRNLLPNFPVGQRRVDGGPITPPSQLILQIKNAIKSRNEVVHTGAPPPGLEELAKMLRAISDLLWLCDVHSGELWAVKHVSAGTRKDWQAKGGS